MAANSRSEEELLLGATLRLNSKVLGLILGILVGLGIFIATNWLVLKGGPIGPGGEPTVGPHLELLGHFFIGYRVTFLGSFIGMAYGFAVGTITGTAIAVIYNRVARLLG